MRFEYFIGRRYLKSRQKHAFISLITLLSIAGVTVGVMALIIVIAVMAGFESDLKARILGVESHLVLMRHGGQFTEYRKVADFVAAQPGVQAAMPFVYAQVMLRTSSGASGALVRGVDPETAARALQFVGRPEAERLGPAQEGEGRPPTPGIILGRELARSLGVLPGDPLYMLSPRGMVSPIGHVPSMERFRVAGIFESGMYDYDGSMAYIHIQEAQEMMRMGDAASGIEIWVDNIYAADELARRLENELGFPYYARDWMQMNRNLFSALKLEKTVMFIILTLIILVAAFNIASSLIMMVMQKTKDIAILKAMGATDRSIRRIFVFKGMIIGVIGTVLGVVFGFGLCVLLEQYQFIELPGNVYYITTLPVQLEWLDVLLISAAALVICFLATLYPARQASKLNPVEAIRYG